MSKAGTVATAEVSQNEVTALYKVVAELLSWSQADWSTPHPVDSQFSTSPSFQVTIVLFSGANSVRTVDEFQLWMASLLDARITVGDLLFNVLYVVWYLAWVKGIDYRWFVLQTVNYFSKNLRNPSSLLLGDGSALSLIHWDIVDAKLWFASIF